MRPGPGGSTDAPQQKKTAEKGVEEEQLAIHYSDSLTTDGTHSVLHVDFRVCRYLPCSDVYEDTTEHMKDRRTAIPAALTDSTPRTLPACSAQGGGHHRRVQAGPMVTVTTTTAHQQTAGVTTAGAQLTGQHHCRHHRRFHQGHSMSEPPTDQRGG